MITMPHAPNCGCPFRDIACPRLPRGTRMALPATDFAASMDRFRSDSREAGLLMSEMAGVNRRGLISLLPVEKLLPGDALIGDDEEIVGIVHGVQKTASGNYYVTLTDGSLVCLSAGISVDVLRDITAPTCATCGSSKFVFYQTITEAADVESFNDDGAAVIGDSKWEQTDCLSTEMRCENGHPLPISDDGWTGDVL
jgi:hypothetical protein